MGAKLLHFTEIESKFLILLRFCIGSSSDFDELLDENEWMAVHRIAEEQGLVGVLFDGIRKLDKEHGPKGSLLFKWIGEAQTIRMRNVLLYGKSAEMAGMLKEAGYRCCILKGQGLSMLYPNPYMRTPGDIDVWIEGGRKIVMDYVNSKCPGQTMRYHHVDYPVFKDVPVEVHFTPSYMNCPYHNAKMQKWFLRLADLQCSNNVALPDGMGEVAVPTLSFNLVYILSHLYRHVFSEGIGLRQLVDYYYVLIHEEDQQGRMVAARSIEHLGMKKFACGVMYIMESVLGMKSKYLLFEPDEKEGLFIMKEVMIGGNFGQYDKRLGDKKNESVRRRWLRMSIRNMRYVAHYPSEALCEPIFRTGFWMWKKWKGYY